MWCYLSLSLDSNIHFPGGPGLANARKSPFWILLELRMMEMVVTTGAVRRTELQSTNQHPVFTGRMSFLSPNQQSKALKGNIMQK